MMISSEEIQVQTINHLRLIAGIIDEIGIEKIINDAVGVDEREIVTPGQIVKAIIFLKLVVSNIIIGTRMRVHQEILPESKRNHTISVRVTPSE
jgi:hypothetical protein